MSSAYFHEDDYCQVEVLPASNLAHCLTEMGLIDEFAAAHSVPGGFTDLYVRGEARQPVSSFGITLAELQVALDPLLPKFTQVYTGYGSHQELCSGAIAWGIPRGVTIFASINKENVIGAIWLLFHAIPPDQLDLWRRVFRSLPRADDLLIADWNVSKVVPLADESALAAYLDDDA